MKTITKTFYRGIYGVEFEKEEECRDYEARVKAFKKLLPKSTKFEKGKVAKIEMISEEINYGRPIFIGRRESDSFFVETGSGGYDTINFWIIIQKSAQYWPLSSILKMKMGGWISFEEYRNLRKVVY